MLPFFDSIKEITPDWYICQVDLNCMEGGSRCCSLQSPLGILEDYTTVKVCGDPLKNKKVPVIPEITEGNIEGWLFSCTGFPDLPPRKKGNKLFKFSLAAKAEYLKTASVAAVAASMILNIY